jgi:lysozyme family protein
MLARARAWWGATVAASEFDAAFAWVVGAEGNYSDDSGDPGNWTGGAIGAGELRGTKYGISAAAYPTLDIASLTLDEARAIYARDYWAPIHGDALPAALALVVFDAAVNSGVGQSGVWLQIVIGAAADGVIGPATLAAVRAWISRGAMGGGSPVADLCAEVLAQRIAANGCDPNFPTFGLGWARRCARLAFQAATMI